MRVMCIVTDGWYEADTFEFTEGPQFGDEDTVISEYKDDDDGQRFFVLERFPDSGFLAECFVITNGDEEEAEVEIELTYNV